MFEYHLATGDTTALELALAGLDAFVSLVDDRQHASDTHIPLQRLGVHCLGHSMIILNLTRQFLEAAILDGENQERVTGLNQRAVQEIDTKFPDNEYDLLAEVLEADWSRPTDENRDFVYLGHGIETLWMLMAEATRRGDTALFQKAATSFKRHVEVASDPVYGGVFRGLHVKEHRYLIDGDCKVKWAHDEVLVGCMLMIEGSALIGMQDTAWAIQTFEATKKYIQDKFQAPLRNRGHPYVLVGGDREVKWQDHYVNMGQPSAPNRKEHYHHPRCHMLIIEAIRRMSGDPCEAVMSASGAVLKDEENTTAVASSGASNKKKNRKKNKKAVDDPGEAEGYILSRFVSYKPRQPTPAEQEAEQGRFQEFQGQAINQVLTPTPHPNPNPNWLSIRS